jgi:hypothetical protein
LLLYVAKPPFGSCILSAFGGNPGNGEGNSDSKSDDDDNKTPEELFQKLYPTDQDQAPIFLLFEKVKNGIALTLQEQSFLNQLPDLVKAYLFFLEKNPIPLGPGFLKTGDTFEFSMTLKLKNVKLTSLQNYVVENNNRLESLVVPRNNNNLASAHLLQKKVKMLFTVIDSENNWSYPETTYNIGHSIFSMWVGHMLPSNVFVERFQLKRIFPLQKVTTRRTVGYGRDGLLNSKTDLINEKSFIFNLNSVLLPGDADSYTIRIPFASQNYKNLSYIPITQQTGSPLVTTVCKTFKGPIKIESHDGGINDTTGSLTVQLSVQSKKENQRDLFAPVSFISPSGFSSNAKTSFTRIYSFEEPLEKLPVLEDGDGFETMNDNDKSIGQPPLNSNSENSLGEEGP